MQRAVQDEPRRSRGVLGPSLAESLPKTGSKIRIPNCQNSMDRYLDVLKMILSVVLGPGGPGGGSVVPLS